MCFKLCKYCGSCALYNANLYRLTRKIILLQKVKKKTIFLSHETFTWYLVKKQLYRTKFSSQGAVFFFSMSAIYKGGTPESGKIMHN